MPWGHVVPFLAAAARVGWRYRHDIMRGFDTYSRHRYRRQRNRQRYQVGYLRGYMRGRRRNPSTGRYARGNRQYYAGGRRRRF